MPVRQDDLQRLKIPFGELIPESDVNKTRILAVISEAKKVATVGDATTERLISFGILPDIVVIDGMERRSKSDRKFDYPAREYRCRNPRGVISAEAIEVLGRAIDEAIRSRIVVDGEEDLLALPLFYMLPLGSVVLYGQPLEGLVAVKITKSKKDEAKGLMDRIMDTTNFNTANRLEKSDGKAKAGSSKRASKHR